MGAVYKAHDFATDRPVAIKVILPGIADVQQCIDRFNREVRTLTKMEHPNIVRLIDFGSIQIGDDTDLVATKLLFFVMDYIEGCNLRSIMGSPEAKSKAVNICIQICDALDYAHKMGILHRDIKPENVLLMRDGHVKLVDFGVSANLDRVERTSITMSGQLLGTPKYIAPEVVACTSADQRSDIYSLGVVLYELVTGVHPTVVLELPSRKCGAVKRLDAIVTTALASNPLVRFESAKDFGNALRRVECCVPSTERPLTLVVAGIQSVLFHLGQALLSIVLSLRLRILKRKRLINLIRGARRIGCGELAHVIDDSGRDEIAALAYEVNKISERYREIIRQLQSKERIED